MKKRLFLVIACLLMLGGCNQGDASKETTNNDAQLIQFEDAQSGDVIATMTTSMGVIKLHLFPKEAPKAVENFVTHAKEGYYNHLTFHRVISDFMIQGGDPNGNGSGGSEETIKGEFSENGVENSLSHTRGAISMARSDDMDSASSQFFIVHKDSTFLDGKYAAFGYVTEGIEVVDQIVEEVLQYPLADERMGLVETEHQPVIKSITVVK